MCSLFVCSDLSQRRRKASSIWVEVPWNDNEPTSVYQHLTMDVEFLIGMLE